MSGTDSELVAWFGANGATTPDLAGAPAPGWAEIGDVPVVPDVAAVGGLTSFSEVWNDEIGDVESAPVDEPVAEEPADAAPTGKPGAAAQVPGSARS